MIEIFKNKTFLSKSFALAFSALAVIVQNKFLVTNLDPGQVGDFYLVFFIPALIPFADMGFGNYLFNRIRKTRIDLREESLISEFLAVRIKHLRVNTYFLLVLICFALANIFLVVCPDYIILILISTFVSARYSLGSKFLVATGLQYQVILLSLLLPVFNCAIVVLFVEKIEFEYFPILYMLFAALINFMLEQNIKRRYIKYKHFWKHDIGGTSSDFQIFEVLKRDVVISLLFTSMLALQMQSPRFYAKKLLSPHDFDILSVMLSFVLPIVALTQSITLQNYLVHIPSRLMGKIIHHKEVVIIPALSLIPLTGILTYLNLGNNAIWISLGILFISCFVQTITTYFNNPKRQEIFISIFASITLMFFISVNYFDGYIYELNLSHFFILIYLVLITLPVLIASSILIFGKGEVYFD